MFVFVVDILIRKLEQTLPGDSTIRAFADDVVMILADAPRSMAKAFHIYKEFAHFSGLRLNHAKTVVIPLSRSALIGNPTYGKRPLTNSAPERLLGKRPIRDSTTLV